MFGSCFRMLSVILISYFFSFAIRGLLVQKGGHRIFNMHGNLSACCAHWRWQALTSPHKCRLETESFTLSHPEVKLSTPGLQSRSLANQSRWACCVASTSPPPPSPLLCSQHPSVIACKSVGTKTGINTLTLPLPFKNDQWKFELWNP